VSVPTALGLSLLAIAVGCAPAGNATVGRLAPFEAAIVWIRHGSDSTRLSVEVARTPAQHEVGLAGRASLEPGAGMLFLFDPPRSPEEGFWMWRTLFPLDLAFIDTEGTIMSIVAMEPCRAPSSDDCPGYFAESTYAAALEVDRGWLSARGVGAGATVRWERITR
jgi:uncharacterized membrane protein (UPF0127 family)